MQSVEAELDHRCCKLGQWYYGHGQEYEGFPAFDALEHPHCELHGLGKELVEAVEQSASADRHGERSEGG
ncbi:CZB domain-containing protein [Candidatus Reidiella endopervernicosa]|uniref:CZB domain-containing protein n=1 Tax=Candidatus Reidiella endopervernicosa TaxID=2738883 RepID=A0A6N0HX09_9GAMM|nr:CZB domain-containing protein [Candidatus Reidiella endopervernicosa]QKQ26920.1 CZB domain-containing protein [Candidatus Reidiella endopervernicosa]